MYYFVILILQQTVLKPPQSVSTNRRDSGNSTISSFYGSSLRSDGGQNSRRSSAMSHVSAALQGISPSTVNGRAVTNASPYDPISPGSSRRSSSIDQHQVAGTDNQPNSLASSSNTLTSSVQAHFQRLHRRALGLSGEEGQDNEVEGSSSTLAMPPQSYGMRNDNSSAFAAFIASGRPIGNSQEIRRMSDPCSSGSRQPGAFTGINNHHMTPSFLQRHQSHNNAPQHNNHNGQNGNGTVNGSFHGHPPNVNVDGSIGDDFIMPDDMATYLSEVQSGANGVTNGNMVMRHGCDPGRPSTCPPASINQLPPPPSYNQAVATHHNNGMAQNGRQNHHHMSQQNVPSYNNGGASMRGGYGNMSVGSPATYGTSGNGSVAAPSPYAQVHSPAYSHASVMSPKNPSVPMHSPMSVQRSSPGMIPPSPSSVRTNGHRNNGNTNANSVSGMQPPAPVEAVNAMGQINSNYGPSNGHNIQPNPVQQQQPHHQSQSQVPTQQSQNYSFHQQYQGQQGYSSNNGQYGSQNNYGPTNNVYPPTGNGNVQAYNQHHQQQQQQQQSTGFYNANSSHYPAHYNNANPQGSYNSSSTAAHQNYGYSNNHHHQHNNCQCPPQQHGPQARGSHQHHHQHQQMYWQQYHQNGAGYGQNQHHNNQAHAGPSHSGNWSQHGHQTMQGNNYSNNWSQGYGHPNNAGNLQGSGHFNKCSSQNGGQDVKPFRRNGPMGHEIQCQSVTSQSQSSQRMAAAQCNPRGNGVPPPPPPHPSQQNGNRASNPSANPPVGMRPDTYQRTLEYVQQCQLWSSSEHKHPITNGAGNPVAPGNMSNSTSKGRDSCNPLSPDSTTTDGKNKIHTNGHNNSNKPSV